MSASHSLISAALMLSASLAWAQEPAPRYLVRFTGHPYSTEIVLSSVVVKTEGGVGFAVPLACPELTGNHPHLEAATATFMARDRASTLILAIEHRVLSSPASDSGTIRYMNASFAKSANPPFSMLNVRLVDANTGQLVKVLYRRSWFMPFGKDPGLPEASQTLIADLSDVLDRPLKVEYSMSGWGVKPHETCLSVTDLSIDSFEARPDGSALD